MGQRLNAEIHYGDKCPHCGCTFKQIIYPYAPKLIQGAI